MNISMYNQPLPQSPTSVHHTDIIDRNPNSKYFSQLFKGTLALKNDTSIVCLILYSYISKKDHFIFRPLFWTKFANS